MSTKAWVTMLMLVGSIIGGYLPILLGASGLSMWTILTSAVGGVLGIWIGLKLGD